MGEKESFLVFRFIFLCICGSCIVAVQPPRSCRLFVTPWNTLYSYNNDISILYLLCQDTFKTLLLIVIAKTELTTFHPIPQYAETYLPQA